MLLRDPSTFAAASLDDGIVDARVVFLTHYIPLYQVRVLQEIAACVRDFHVLLSTPIEPNRDFTPDWGGLDVTVQNTWTVRRRWKHRDSKGTKFNDELYVHIPYDTQRRLRQLRPDVVMSLELGARSLGATHYCRRNPGTKSILCTYMSEHTERHRGWLRQTLRKRLVRRADALTYNGPSCQSYLQQLGVPDNALYHFPYAADDRTLHMGPVERVDGQTRHRLLCVGQLSERKGVLPMMTQLQRYCIDHPEQSIEMRLAGDGPLRDQLQSLSLPTNLTLTLLGNVPAKELSTELRSCGAVIAPTLADEWLLVVNESLQAGTPVIGSIYAQAVTTLIRDGINGWQYDPADESSLARSLNAYFGVSADRLTEMRHECRDSVEERTPAWAASGAVQAIRELWPARVDSETAVAGVKSESGQ
ncbi:glycosyltransferase family 4 protein [Stieleria varia]|uniref:Glycosyl transferases group 1 n=1 Tax=Stieleria varia TaxID=2528005 RepID=A0A5C6A5A6_9BACT|nr:glycosyltransferase family 4 protein [Stieleria varia]TWT94659.1 Glycosyl transferases group 1 [Stieleria varia]